MQTFLRLKSEMGLSCKHSGNYPHEKSDAQLEHHQLHPHSEDESFLKGTENSRVSDASTRTDLIRGFNIWTWNTTLLFLIVNLAQIIFQLILGKM